MILKRTTDPTIEPVTLDAVKLHLRVDDEHEDTLISSLITAAREMCEAFQGRSYLSQVWRLSLDAFPASDGTPIYLPMSPVVSVTSIVYTASDGTATTWGASNYTLDSDSEPARIFPAYTVSWPTTRAVPQAVKVVYAAGYGATAASTPGSVKQAMMLLIGHWFENREAVLIGVASKEIELAVKNLLWPEAVFMREQ